MDSLKVAEVGSPITDCLEVVDGEVDVCSASHGEQVKDLEKISLIINVRRAMWRLTEFVEPPRTLTMVIAFKKDWRVRISLQNVQAVIPP